MVTHFDNEVIVGFIISAASGGSHGFFTSVHGSASYISLIWSNCIELRNLGYVVRFAETQIFID